MNMQNNRFRSAFGVLVRLMVPIAYGIIRNFKGIHQEPLPKLVSFDALAGNKISLNLASTQVLRCVNNLLRFLKIRNSPESVTNSADIPNTNSEDISSTEDISAITAVKYSSFGPLLKSVLSQFLEENERKSLTQQPPPPKCCEVTIMAEPPAGQPIRADIVFIHGLHGSLTNTWRQGAWKSECQPEYFERPRNSSAVIHQNQHRPYECATQRDMDNQFTYMCGEPKDIGVFEDSICNFSELQLKANDNDRQLHSELDNTQNLQFTESRNEPILSPDDPGYSKCWPGDWLPLDCPGVRIIAITYTTDQQWRLVWKKKQERSNIVERSREMAQLLVEYSVGCGRPIVWVGHSKGGLFVKQIIVDAWENGCPEMAPFWRSARGIFFYSVPHRGSSLASLRFPLLLRSVEIIEVQKDYAHLLHLHRRFLRMYQGGDLKVEIFSFLETAVTMIYLLNLRIVSVESADPGIGAMCGINLDHREICKPRSRNCILYKQLVKMINDVC